MNGKQFVKDYLTFTRKERIGLLSLVFTIFIVILLPKAIHNSRSHLHPTADTSWITAVRKLEIRDSQSRDENNFGREPADNEYAYHFDRTVNKSAPVPILYYFDPNTLDVAGWQKLGLKYKTIHTIQNYVSKGGHFYKPEDLKRIYGLHPDEFLRLEPYVKIEGGTAHNKPVENAKTESGPKNLSMTVDINLADTVAFISLPGIGAKLATRIVNFREKLGGFYSVAQVAETYGLPDSTFQKIKEYLKIDSNPVKKININTASVDELKAHPYIRYSIAGPIVAYRNEHGPFSKLDDIKKVLAVTDEVYNKIAHYLSL